jgi:hypothetical protein
VRDGFSPHRLLLEAYIPPLYRYKTSLLNDIVDVKRDMQIEKRMELEPLFDHPSTRSNSGPCPTPPECNALETTGEAEIEKAG